jgi:hypothetical protein
MSEEWTKTDKQRFLIMVLLCLAVFFVGFEWLVDISFSNAMANAVGCTAFMQNILFKNADPIFLYHVGLIGLGAVFLLSMVIIVFLKME